VASNNSLTLTAIDFDTLKQQFLSWLQGQSSFQDYKFNSSSMNVLLDVLSYNSYLNAFYLNMTFSEMFLDTAQKLDSVVSHAKELNYLPRSAASSEASISFTVSTSGISNPFTIPLGTTFVGRNSNGNFTFTTAQNQTFISTNSTYVVSNLAVYEGTYKTDSFVINTSNAIPSGCLTFLLTNQNIDLGSLTLTVSQDNGANVAEWSEVSTLYGLNGNSTVYFVQAAQNLQYEILFGDGLFGAVPQNGAIITAQYRVASGPAADGVSNFTCTVDLGAVNGGIATLSAINAVSTSTAGQLQQGIESVRFTAPRYYAAQERAVASGDYSALVLAQFGGTIQDCTSYGGELLTPKQYGTTAVCVKPTTGLIASNTVKNAIMAYMAPLIVVPGKIVITDPIYFYIGVTTTVTYDPTQTSSSASTLQAQVLNAILSFNEANIDTFNADFYYTQFCTAVDAADPSILSNDTDVTIISRLTPPANTTSSYVINFNNPAEQESGVNQVYVPGRLSDEPVLWSSTFTYTDATGVAWPLSILRDDNRGGIVVMTTVNGIVILPNQSIGTIDYATGAVTITGLNASSYGSYISLYMSTQSVNLDVQQNQILLIDLADVSVTMSSAT
jgi:Straboviridae baseplate wedge protein Gp6